jgi:hypothetical protein
LLPNRPTLTLVLHSFLQFKTAAAAVAQILANDPRSPHSKGKADTYLFGLAFDRLDIVYRVRSLSKFKAPPATATTPETAALCALSSPSSTTSHYAEVVVVEYHVSMHGNKKSQTSNNNNGDVNSGGSSSSSGGGGGGYERPYMRCQEWSQRLAPIVAAADAAVAVAATATTLAMEME